MNEGRTSLERVRASNSGQNFFIFGRTIPLSSDDTGKIANFGHKIAVLCICINTKYMGL